MIDPVAFVDELANRIAEQLRRRAPEFKKHRIGAVACLILIPGTSGLA